MLRKIITQTLLAICLTGTVAQAKPGSDFAHNFTPEHKPIMVSSSRPQFSIRVPANHTTGFTWFLKDYNSRILRVISQRYIKATGDRLGQTGVSVWTFRVLPEAFKVQQISKITLYYAQPWDLNNGSKKLFTIVTHHCDKNGNQTALHHYRQDGKRWVC